ncbi:MAG: hypothetical protein OXU62_08170 [Gammaproteobacteria bacterium]|nr:hypothetical protein [Gammaproteobacteria bacterium]
MLSKILFTLAVIFGVVVFFRHRHGHGRVLPAAAAGAVDAASAAGAESAGGSIPPRVLAYGLLGILGGVAVLIFALDKQRGERIVTIRVTAAATEAVTEYRARRRAIDGRNFTTVDGVRVTPAAGDRIEMRAP